MQKEERTPKYSLNEKAIKYQLRIKHLKHFVNKKEKKTYSEIIFINSTKIY